MLTRRIIAGILLTVVSTAAVFAQAPLRETSEPSTRDYLSTPWPTNPGGGLLNGLLDPSRIMMSHSIGMSYMSSGSDGYTQGYYMNTMAYRFNAPLLLRLHLGVANDPFSDYNSYSPDQSPLANTFANGQFIGGADLDWRPAKNVRMFLSIHKNSRGLYGLNPYSNYWSNRYLYDYFGNRDPSAGIDR